MNHLTLVTISLSLLFSNCLQGEQQFMKEKHWYVVILAGGKGERLWPLSTEKSPKQVLPFQKGKSLLQATIKRVSQTVPKKKIWVVTTKKQKKLISQHIQDSISTILSEPAARNTAAAILYTCLHIQQKDPEAVIAFLPADHYIKENNLFMQNLTQALTWANQHQTIVLLGIKPTFPATGYGYIEHKLRPCPQSAFRQVLKFHEKPSKEIAIRYIKKNNMLWNAGMFCSRADVFIREFVNHAPTTYEQVIQSLDKPEIYKKIENISVDHAIMEKSSNIHVLPVSFSWSDVGNLDIFLSLLDKHQNKLDKVTVHESSNNLVYANKKHVALIGVHNLCIVETDDALLIADRKQVEKVKKVLEVLKY